MLANLTFLDLGSNKLMAVTLCEIGKIEAPILIWKFLELYSFLQMVPSI